MLVQDRFWEIPIPLTNWRVAATNDPLKIVLGAKRQTVLGFRTPTRSPAAAQGHGHVQAVHASGFQADRDRLRILLQPLQQGTMPGGALLKRRYGSGRRRPAPRRQLFRAHIEATPELVQDRLPE